MNYLNKNILLVIIAIFITTTLTARELQKLEKKMGEQHSKLIDYRKTNPMEVGEHIVFPVMKEIVDYYFFHDHDINTSSLPQRIIDNEKTETDKLIANLLITLIEKTLLNNKKSLSIKKQKEILEFILDYKAKTGSILSNASFFLNNFYDEKYYSPKMKKVIKKQLLPNNNNNNICGDVLLILDAAGLKDDDTVKSFIDQKAGMCKAWGNRSYKWFALLLSARWGNEVSLRKLCRISKIEMQNQERRYQAYYMPFELAIVHNEAITMLLQSFLPAKKEYHLSSLESANLGGSSASSLQASIDGFPDTNRGKYYNIFSSQLTPEQVNKYNVWLDKNKPYKYRHITKFPSEIKMRIWR
jgi:hypothetical protein